MEYDKIIISFDPNTRSLYDTEGNYIGVMVAGIEVDEYVEVPPPVDDDESGEYKQLSPPSEKDETVIELVKLGVTPDEIIKLKHSGLL